LRREGGKAMGKVIKRYLDYEPQIFKVVGFSVKPKSIERTLNLKMQVSNSRPLDVITYFNELTQAVYFKGSWL